MSLSWIIRVTSGTAFGVFVGVMVARYGGPDWAAFGFGVLAAIA